MSKQDSNGDTVVMDHNTARHKKAEEAKPLNDGVQAEKVSETVDRLLVRLVPLKEIAFARRTKDPKDQIGFFNPRQDAGLDKLSMEELQDSIAQDGLFEYPNIRLIEKNGETTYQLIAGERRIRAISYLVERNALVYDEATNKKTRASILYETVPCRVIRNADDMKALRIAIQENGQHRQVSEGDLLDVCEWMLDREVDIDGEHRKMSRAEVADHLGKSESWLCQTLSFRTRLDENIRAQLFEGKINRSYVLDLMCYEEGKRPIVNEAAHEVAKERFETTLERAEAEVGEAEVGLELANEKVVTAVNNQKEETAKKTVQKAKVKLQKATERVKQIEEIGVRVQQSDLVVGAIEVGIQPLGTKGLSTKQLHDHWLSRLDVHLSTEKVRHPKTQRVYPRRDILLVRCVAQAIAEGSSEPLQSLDAFYEQQGGWGMFGSDGLSGKMDVAKAALERIDNNIDIDDDLDQDEMDDDDDIDDLDLDFNSEDKPVKQGALEEDEEEEDDF